MKADYPDRKFQLWEYKVSHGSLLVRSPKTALDGFNVDLMFSGVEFVSLPRHMLGIALEEPTIVEWERVAGMCQKEIGRDQMYVLASQGHRYFIVAAGCRVAETTVEIFDSPFS
jgi:hypothetical protein